MGRPSIATASLKLRICAAIAAGDGLIAICKRKGMPARSAVYEWLATDKDFADMYARAREVQADFMDEKILAVADKTTAKNANASRVRIDAYKWRAAKLKPKVYGDLQKVEHSGSIGIEALVIQSRQSGGE